MMGCSGSLWLRIVGSATVWAGMLAGIGQAAEPPVGWRYDGSGCFPGCQPPTTWSLDEGVAWKRPLEQQSLASPVVVGDRVLTMAEPADLICVSLQDGELLWKRSHTYGDLFDQTKAEQIAAQHAEAEKIDQKLRELQEQLKKAQDEQAPNREVDKLERQIASFQRQYDALTPYPPVPGGSPGNTTSTPVADGESVYAAFATGIVSAHDLNGNRKWMQFVEKPAPRHTASPLRVNHLLIVHLKHLIALDAETGELVWKTDTPTRNGTSVTVQLEDETLIVTPAGAVVRADDGQLLAKDLFNLAYCSPVAHEDVVYAIEQGAAKAVRIRKTADGQIEAQPLWESAGARDERLASPVVHEGLLYSITSNGILEVHDAHSGERVYRKRLDFGSGRTDPSLAVAGNRLYVSGNSGVTFVLKPGREYEEIARNELEGFSSSLAFDSTRVCVRTTGHLYCLEGTEEKLTAEDAGNAERTAERALVRELPR